jgi:hypothetical protein
MTTPNRKVIYSASQADFFQDVLLNQVASKMRENQNSFSNSKVTDLGKTLLKRLKIL